MGIIARQSIANALFTYLGIGLGAALTLILYPRILNPEQYGLTRVLISASVIGAQFSHLGMRNIIIRFFPLFRSAGGSRSGLLFLALVIPLAGFLLFTLLFFILQEPLSAFYSERSPLFTDYLFYILPISLFILYFEILNSYLRSLRDSLSGSFVSEVLHRILLIVLLLIYAFSDIQFNLFILLFTVTYSLQPLLLAAVLAARGNLDLRPRLDFVRKSLAKQMASYGTYTLLGGLTTVVVWNVDIMMLGSLSGLDQTAVYAVAFYIGIVIAVPQRAVEKIATPLISEFIRDRKWSEIASIYRKTSLVQTISGSAILLMIWMNSAPLLALLPDIYATGGPAILLIGIGKLIDMATGINGSIILTSRHYRFDLLTNLFLIVLAVGMNLLLIPEHGTTGAALATMIAIFFYNLIKFIYVWLKFSMQPFTTEHLKLIIPVLLTAGAGWILPDLALLSNLVVTSLLLFILYLLPVWAMGLSPDLNRLIRQIFGLSKKCFK